MLARLVAGDLAVFGQLGQQRLRDHLALGQICLGRLDTDREHRRAVAQLLQPSRVDLLHRSPSGTT